MKKEYTLKSGKTIIALVFKSEDQETYAEVFRSNFESKKEETEFTKLAALGDLNPETDEYENQINDVRFIERETKK